MQKVLKASLILPQLFFKTSFKTLKEALKFKERMDLIGKTIGKLKEKMRGGFKEAFEK